MWENVNGNIFGRVYNYCLLIRAYGKYWYETCCDCFIFKFLNLPNLSLVTDCSVAQRKNIKTCFAYLSDLSLPALRVSNVAKSVISMIDEMGCVDEVKLLLWINTLMGCQREKSRVLAHGLCNSGDHFCTFILVPSPWLKSLQFISMG